jgi:hypothetical protein
MLCTHHRITAASSHMPYCTVYCSNDQITWPENGCPHRMANQELVKASTKIRVIYAIKNMLYLTRNKWLTRRGHASDAFGLDDTMLDWLGTDRERGFCKLTRLASKQKGSSIIRLHWKQHEQYPVHHSLVDALKNWQPEGNTEDAPQNCLAHNYGEDTSYRMVVQMRQ